MNKELKLFIEQKEKEASNEAFQRYQARMTEAQKDFESRVNLQEKKDTYYSLIGKAHEFANSNPEVFIKSRYAENVYSIKSTDEIATKKNNEAQKEYQEELEVIKAKFSSLILQLSLEKDFDRIKDILKNAGIEI